jgi:ABC-type nitrate/sulfonate/bicarbonate transport system substrate-binding protein
MRQRVLPALLATAVLALTACGDDDDADAPDPAPATSGAPGALPGEDVDVVAGEPFPATRCEANRAAGTIRYLSGFDFAATASIIDIVVAEESGYYDEVCLDVELVSSFSTSNYPLVAGGEGHVASGGSFSEVVDYAITNEVDLVAVDVEGRSAIDSLIVKPGAIESLEDVRGTTIGVKGKLPPSVAAMLAGAGLTEGTDFETVLLDGFDPIAHYHLDGIVGFPGYKSNEPGQLERAELEFDLFDPTEHGVPGSFGVLFATRSWAETHPTALQDFLRATMRGLADALADPDRATAMAVELVESGGNPSYLSLEGETFRWRTDTELLGRQDASIPPGVPDLAALQAELDAYARVGLFGGEPPDAARYVLEAPIAGVYDEQGQVIWPGR